MEKKKEEYVIILDYLANGYPMERKMMPIVQAIGENNLSLLELVPKKDVKIDIGEKVYIGDGKRDKIYYILGRLHREKLTETSKEQLQEFINKIVKEREKEFIEFFNKSQAINKRVHQIELLPGMGKKHMKEILNIRKEKDFESFIEMKNRIPNLPDPERAIAKRIFEELTNMERFNLFTQ